MATLYTIGHSTRTLDEFLSVLRAHEIQTLADIRAFPASRRLPHFNREALETALPNAGIRYLWMKGLGGYRKKTREESPNVALRNASFRNYADYMLTPEFEAAIADLIHVAQESPTAYMCAERVWFQCHRMLVSDWLVAHGHTVLHIDAEGPPKAPLDRGSPPGKKPIGVFGGQPLVLNSALCDPRLASKERNLGHRPFPVLADD